MPIPLFDALILGGGRSSRMGGVDKATLSYRSHSLLERALDACSGAAATVVVAPDSPAVGTARRVLEDPPFGGPVAGIAAGMTDLAYAGPAPWVLVLAVDYPESPAAVARLLDAAEDVPGVDAYAAVDGAGFRQNLLALYRRPALDGALAALGGVRDRSVRSLVAPLNVVEVPLDDALVGDVDDPESAHRYGIEVPHAP
ncbi:molybdenum cofactor guanylyltransferase [Mariniluteicoccus flavus]